ncbi:MAG: hypothetical protein H0U99_02210, partial [Chthoniobacterales bacterium]|nr:hypothetical protein [Chthoniobacterales bacterium]
MRKVLIAHNALFKVPARLEFLATINSGIGQFSQIGKFLTVYPRSTTEAVALARALHTATRGLRGPEIPFDARYRRNSVVYYRYGAFRNSKKSARLAGELIDDKGRRCQDRRAAGYAVPRWLVDPFQRADATRAKPFSSRGLIGTDYLVFRAIVQRGKGGVYEAVDLSVSPARLVIIKEGRREGETAWDGRD